MADDDRSRIARELPQLRRGRGGRELPAVRRARGRRRRRRRHPRLPAGPARPASGSRCCSSPRVAFLAASRRTPPSCARGSGTTATGSAPTMLARVHPDQRAGPLRRAAPGARRHRRAGRPGRGGLLGRPLPLSRPLQLRVRRPAGGPAQRRPPDLHDQRARSRCPTGCREVAARVGIDLNPLDPADPDDRAWLRALVWPGPNAAARLERLDAAAAHRRGGAGRPC